MSTSVEPEVSWARPLIRLERAAREAGELLEAGKTDAAMDEMLKIQQQLNLAVEFVLRSRA